MQFSNQQLRELILAKFATYPGIEIHQKASMIGEAFPGTFNLSFNEPDLLEEFGSRIEYTKNLFFTKIQPVIRPNDLNGVIALLTDTKHLGTYELGGISIADIESAKLYDHLQKFIEVCSQLLFQECGLDPKKVYIKVCKGGSIEQLTKGHYQINKMIPRDDHTYAEWRNHGIPEENFIWNDNRDTFLSLFNFKNPTPWGYRNEILYDVGEGLEEDNLLDIGTVEYFPWRPVFEEREGFRYYMTKDIIPWEYAMVAGGFGIERLLMAVNNLRSAVDCDHVKPLYDTILADASNKDTDAAFILTETLRVSHRVLIDSRGYVNLSTNRKQKFNPYIIAMQTAIDTLGIPLKKIRDYLELNASLQPYYLELDDFDFVARQIGYMFERRFEDYPAWPMAEYFEGREGLIKVAEEILKEKGTDVDTIFSSELMRFVPEYSDYFNKLRQERKIFLRAITDKSVETIDRKQNDEKEYRKTKFSDKIVENLKSAIYILDKKVVMITATEREQGGMIVENKEIVQILKAMFENTWNKTADESG